MSSSLTFSRAALVAGILVLGLSACGRRGALEPPPDPTAVQQSQAASASPEGTLPSPVGTPSKKSAARGYTIPEKSFFLDPLL